jgi:hypothetical protein
MRILAADTAHARRQYDAVDPDNRLVASELERRWNDKLIEARRLEDELEAFDTQRQPVLGEQEREHLMRLGADLEIAWSHPAATVTTRKRIVRAVLHEIVVNLAVILRANTRRGLSFSTSCAK